MRILFTRGNSIASKLIMGITHEPVSHCAIECSGWIIQSNFLGVHVELPQTFEKSSQIVYSVDIEFDPNRVMSALASCEGSWYDFGGMFYIGLRYLLPFLPKKNLWKESGMFMCTEWVTEILEGKPDSMITPYQLYLQLKKRSN